MKFCGEMSKSALSRGCTLRRAPRNCNHQFEQVVISIPLKLLSLNLNLRETFAADSEQILPAEKLFKPDILRI